MKMLFLIATLFVSLNVKAETCTFSPEIADGGEISSPSCGTKLCSHVIVCDGAKSTVVCPARNGTCNGYDAAACKTASARIVEDAQFEPYRARAVRTGVGGR